MFSTKCTACVQIMQSVPHGCTSRKGLSKSTLSHGGWYKGHFRKNMCGFPWKILVENQSQKFCENLGRKSVTKTLKILVENQSQKFRKFWSKISNKYFGKFWSKISHKKNVPWWRHMAPSTCKNCGDFLFLKSGILFDKYFKKLLGRFMNILDSLQDDGLVESVCTSHRHIQNCLWGTF